MLGLSPEAQIERVVRYATARGLQRIAALVPPGPFELMVTRALRGDRGDKRYKGQPGREFVTPDEIAASIKLISDYDDRRAALLEQRKELEGREERRITAGTRQLEILDAIGSMPFDALANRRIGAGPNKRLSPDSTG